MLYFNEFGISFSVRNNFKKRRNDKKGIHHLKPTCQLCVFCGFHMIINMIGETERHLPKQLVQIVGTADLIGTGEAFDRHCGLLQQ